jgi:hypothetical protein
VILTGYEDRRRPEGMAMADNIETGAILIKEGALLPRALRFESENCVPGWKLVKDLDRYGLAREIHEAGWTFIYLADETRAAVFGMDEQKMVRRAIEQILANPKSQKFNSVEITQVTSVDSDRFLGVHYVTVSAHSRHIQEARVSSDNKDLPEFETARRVTASQLSSARWSSLLRAHASASCEASSTNSLENDVSASGIALFHSRPG